MKDRRFRGKLANTKTSGEEELELEEGEREAGNGQREAALAVKSCRQILLSHSWEREVTAVVNMLLLRRNHRERRARTTAREQRADVTG